MDNERIVLSASRRTELLHFPEKFLDKLAKYQSELVHSIVIWTKTPHLLFSSGRKKLVRQLLEYDQLYFHVTITGLGASFLEPNTRPAQDVIDLLPRLIDLTTSPKRVNIRFDPIVNLQHKTGRSLSNVDCFPTIAEQCKEQGITEFTTSWMAAYEKVQRRLSKLGFVKFEAADALKRKQAEELTEWATNRGVNLQGCCTQPHVPGHGCINGRLLSELHPRHEQCALRTAPGQRDFCACTLSRDIGWYSSCPNGCAYCYGHPQFDVTEALTLMESWRG